MNTIPFKGLYCMAVLFSALTNIVLGFLVLSDSSHRKTNRLFAILCASLSLWGFSFVGFNLSTGTMALNIWAALFLASVLYTAPLFFHLITGAIGSSTKDIELLSDGYIDRLKQLAYVFSSGWFFLTLSGHLPHSFRNHPSLSFPELGSQYWVALLFYGFLALTSVVILVRQIMVATDAAQKSRLSYLLVGTLALAVGCKFNLHMVYSSPVNHQWGIPLGFMLTSVCLVCVAYGLTTSQLYHFAEILRKSTSFLAMTIILVGVFGGTHFLSNLLLMPYIPRSDYFALTMASIAMSIMFHPLRFRVQNMVDRVFFAKRYDQMQRLRGLSRRILSSADRDELTNILFTSLRGIGFGSITLLLKDPQKSLFHIKKAVGLSEKADGFFVKSDSLIIQYLREEKQELIKDEVIRRIMTDWERHALSDEMGILESEISFPLFSSRRRALFGVISLGKSDLGYSSYKGRNIFWLKSVIENAGIMLDNFYHQEFANALIPYVGRTWADEMRRNKEGFRERLEGHRTLVSVIMVDIRHFTGMSSRMAPEEVVSLLQEFRLAVAPIVYRHSGTIDKFIGDAIMIVFGLPILPALANPDKNAVECALDIMKEIELLNKKRMNANKEGIAIGMGISSGDVIAGNVDSGDRVEYTVIGDAVNMVARLEDLAGDNQILLSPLTYSKIKGSFETLAWPSRLITGFDEPLVVHELIIYHANTKLHVIPAKRLSNSERMASNE